MREIVVSSQGDDPFEQLRILFEDVSQFSSGDYTAAEKEIGGEVKLSRLDMPTLAQTLAVEER